MLPDDMDTSIHTGLGVDSESRTALVGSSPNNDRNLSEDGTFEDVPVNNTASCKDTGRWSNTNTTASTKKIRPSVRLSSIKTTAATALSKTGMWTHEVVGLLVGTADVAGIAIVLACFDGRAIPDWPFNNTLSALIALLATIADANLAAPIQSSISPLKWIRFKTRRTPLH